MSRGDDPARDMTIREAFAVKLGAGLLSNSIFVRASAKAVWDGARGIPLVVEGAIEAADALIAELEKSKQEDRPGLRLVDLELSVRSCNILSGLCVNTVNELVALSPAELRKQRNCGRTAVDEIKRQLGRHGLTLRDTE